MNDFSDTCKRENVKHETILETGIVANEICERAKLSDLVIVGKHGINVEFKHGFLGSTAERVMRKSPQPVMVVTDRFEEITNPLIAYDGGASASKALHYAAEFSKTIRLPLTVATLSKGGSPGEALKNAEDYLKPYNISTRFVFLEGDTSDEIIRYYKENSHNLIFMGFSGHPKIYEMVLGSTTEYVMRNIDGPIFAAR